MTGRRIQEFAIKRTWSIFPGYNRINEPGVAEPVIAQQGADFTVVQLPGYRTRPKPGTFWAAPRRLNLAGRSHLLVHWKFALVGQVSSGPNSTSKSRGGRPLAGQETSRCQTGDRLDRMPSPVSTTRPRKRRST
ncbi:hypothetical protein [Propionivibrio sp.]|uniref:hypothetical protein n=1 Tax=Propionivibrio sp. TaxID=2212460 RepID=UPI00345CCEBC